MTASHFVAAPDFTNAPRVAKKFAPRFNLLGVKIDNVTMDQALADILQSAQGAEPVSYAFVNADCLNHATQNATYCAVLANNRRVFADGSGIAMAMRLRGERVVENVNGTDMFPRLCTLAAERGLSMFLMGAAPGVACQAAANMTSAIPALNIAGTHHGFIADMEERVIEQINSSKADIVLVAMGAPRQELWIARNRDKLNAKVVIGVGGLLDFYSGRIARAPLALRVAGLEWTWRLLQEPARMWRRYILGNPLFLSRCLLEQISVTRHNLQNEIETMEMA